MPSSGPARREGEEQEKASHRWPEPLDVGLSVGLAVILVPLSLWGGSKSWAGDTDALPLVMFAVGGAYLLFECFRHRSMKWGASQGAAVPLLVIGPSLLLYPEELEVFIVAVVLGGLAGGFIVALTKLVSGKGIVLARAYTIHRHPDKGLAAVKKGFSWPGFFFTWIWAIFKSLGGIAVVLAILHFLVLGLSNSGDPEASILGSVLAISVCLTVGFKGNDWRRKRLVRRGYEDLGRVSARRVSEAISQAGSLEPPREEPGPSGVPAPSSKVGSPDAIAQEKAAHSPKREVSQLCHRAMAAIERNELSSALQDLTRAEALDPSDPFVHLLLYQAYGITRDYDSAARHFQSLRELDPSAAGALLKGIPDSLRDRLCQDSNLGEETGQAPGDAKKRETTLYAYLAEGQGTGLPGFRQTVVLPAAKTDLEDKIRASSGCKNAEVTIVPPEEWSPPQFNSVSQQEIQEKFPLVMARIQGHMARSGLPKVSQDELIRNGSVMPNPVSGKVFFICKITS